jgi:hypothetical protein
MEPRPVPDELLVGGLIAKERGRRALHAIRMLLVEYTGVDPEQAKP